VVDKIEILGDFHKPDIAKFMIMKPIAVVGFLLLFVFRFFIVRKMRDKMNHSSKQRIKEEKNEQRWKDEGVEVLRYI
jgi:flagellar biosynthesis/type III secretory pathway M-ring protein FliF/YscJ